VILHVVYFLGRALIAEAFSLAQTTARVLASQAEAIVRIGKHGHNIE